VKRLASSGFFEQAHQRLQVALVYGIKIIQLITIHIQDQEYLAVLECGHYNF
jgi:hypothetical protein